MKYYNNVTSKNKFMKSQFGKQNTVEEPPFAINEIFGVNAETNC